MIWRKNALFKQSKKIFAIFSGQTVAHKRVFMPQDAVTLKKLSLELNALLSGAKINKITQPSPDEVILWIYSENGNAKLSISASALFSHVGFTSADRKNPAVAPGFCMLLRKHLINSSIKSAELLGSERIIKLSFNGKNDFLEPVEKQLYCEIMGKYSNVILCENNVIAGTMKPAQIDFSKDRTLLCGVKYALPKAQEKLDFNQKTQVLQYFSDFSGGNLADYVFNGIKGFSLAAAKEAVFRTFNKTDFEYPLEAEKKLSPEQIYGGISKFLNGDKPTPCVVFSNERVPLDYFFTDYITVGGEKRFFECLSDAEEFYFDQKRAAVEQKELFNKLNSAVNSALKKERKRLQTILDKEIECENGEKYRICGELITANIYKIKRGDKILIAQNYYDDNAEIKIALDETVSPNANAQKYFKKYTKVKNTLKAILPQKQQTEAEIDYLSSVLSEISSAQNLSDLIDVEDELKQNGIIKTQSGNSKIKKADLKINYRLFQYNGYKIRAGKNNIQNDKLTFSSKPSDIWLHAKNYHSAHVVIENIGGHVPDEIILMAAEICAFYSEAKGGGKVEIDYCQKKYVKKPPQAKSGAVIYTDFKTVLVTPSSHKNLEA